MSKKRWKYKSAEEAKAAHKAQNNSWKKRHGLTQARGKDGHWHYVKKKATNASIVKSSKVSK